MGNKLKDEKMYDKEDGGDYGWRSACINVCMSVNVHMALCEDI